MEQIGTSSLWEKKYAPQCFSDLILPKKFKLLFQKMLDGGEIQNILLAGTAGLGKTSTATVLAKELGADFMFINASLDNSIDVVRSKVQQFAMTSSFADGKKIVLLDEVDRMMAGQEALKAMMELTESNCRFIFTTNNISKIIDPLKSRTRMIDFSFSESDNQEVILQYFKRCQFILTNEKIEFDKKVLAEFIKKIFPDFRKIIGELQKASQMFGKIDEAIYSIQDDAIVNSLIDELKAKKFVNVQKIASNLDPNQFFPEFYAKMVDVLDPKCIPDMVLILGEGAYRNGVSTDREINLMATLVQVMKAGVWK
jgi:DNA polymerase III delta prime subunit